MKPLKIIAVTTMMAVNMAVIGFTLAVISPVQAAVGDCAVDALAGAYGYSYSGTVFGQPIAAVGPITFDGQGKVAGRYTVSLGGQTIRGTFTDGSYTVRIDCTGTAIANFPDAGIILHAEFVLINDGEEAFFTGTDQDITVEGIVKRRLH